MSSTCFVNHNNVGIPPFLHPALFDIAIDHVWLRCYAFVLLNDRAYACIYDVDEVSSSPEGDTIHSEGAIWNLPPFLSTCQTHPKPGSGSPWDDHGQRDSHKPGGSITQR
jgi:hypothetical protein